MRKLLVIIVPVMLIVSTLAAVVAGEESNIPRDPDRQAEVSTEETNLLYNPSFEGNYSSYNPPPPGLPDCNYTVCSTANMADGWTPWWLKIRQEDVNPEYKPAELWHTNPDRVRSGSRAQQYFSFASTHEAGFYQQVSVLPGEVYCFNIWGHSWSAIDDDDAYSGPDDGWLDQKVGIDPSGGVDPTSSNIKWGPPRVQYDEYGQFSVCTNAQSDLMTVFTYSRPIWPVKHNDVYWDDASLFSPDLSSGISISPTNGIQFSVEDGSNQILTGTATINLPDVSGLIWMAELETGGNLDVSFSPQIGHPNDQIVVTIDSTEYSTGRYSAQIVVDTELDIPGSPVALPVELIVAGDLYAIFLPNVSN